jgi:hypothetical protein
VPRKQVRVHGRSNYSSTPFRTCPYYSRSIFISGLIYSQVWDEVGVETDHDASIAGARVSHYHCYSVLLQF